MSFFSLTEVSHKMQPGLASVAEQIDSLSLIIGALILYLPEYILFEGLNRKIKFINENSLHLCSF